MDVFYEDFEGAEMCIPFHTVKVGYPDKTIWLIYSQDSGQYLKDTKFDQDFLKSNDDEVMLNIVWETGQFKDLLVVGEHAIRPDLDFEYFKKLFPLSARQSVAALAPGWNMRKNDTQTYIVEVNFREAEPYCLDQTVEFTFSEGQLSNLTLRNYPTWCSC
jgi:hypothetical protein